MDRKLHYLDRHWSGCAGDGGAVPGPPLRGVQARLAIDPAVAASPRRHCRTTWTLAALDASVAALASAQQRRGPQYTRLAGRHMVRVARRRTTRYSRPVVPHSPRCASV
ncbi:hypothetical protein HBB16_19755 [Pseudonocardia sp. MCCB 268]|nr:hypothetical protein [Pseudonocardia cytotoxica]